jgi:hypothetical protein
MYSEEVSKTMSRNRFQFIMRSLHLVPKTSIVKEKTDPRYDPIGPVRWMMDDLMQNFNTVWSASSFLCVDECMVGYNGQYCSFKQYLPLKPITHGIKIWCLACSKSKYVLNWEVYVGAANELAQGLPVHECGAGAGVVTRLTTGWEGMNYTVVTDNYFTSPMLYEDLLSRGFYAVGTVRQGRGAFPTSLHMPEKGNRGSLQIRMHRERRMAAVHWYDSKGVHFLSTAADPVQLYGVTTMRRQGGAALPVPTSPIQLMYADNMRGVDTQDQYRAGFSTQIFTKKWWHRFFFFGFDSALTNSYIVHKQICISRGLKYMEHRKFQLAVAQALMGRPLPEGFGMPLSQSASGSRQSAGGTQSSGHAEAMMREQERRNSAPSTEGEDLFCSQESMSRATIITGVVADDRDQNHSFLPGIAEDSVVEAAVRTETVTNVVDMAPRPRRCRRPNRPNQERGGPEVLMNMLRHYSKKKQLRRLCRGCRRRTKWICPGCRGFSMCPGECFVGFHKLLGM